MGRAALALVALGFLAPSLAAEEWEQVLAASLGAEHSQTRQDGVKQVDTSSVKGLKALWKVLAIRDPSKVDWYVREGAAEALANASGEDADKEIDRLISKGDEDELAREAILYSIDLKVRRAAVRLNGGNDDRKIEEAKYVLSKARGVQYFALVLPAVQEIDPSKKLLKRLQTGLNDKSARVRRAAIQGLVTYPDNSSVAPLLENLKKLEKKKAQNYREWVLTRFALETLTGQYYRDNVQDWLKWWEIAKGQFSLEKRVEEEKDKPPEGKTVVVRREGVEVNINMKVAGAPDGYPLLVIPWQGYEVDYFRPYFHGVEDVCRVYYVRMPNIDDFKGLARTKESNTIQYPTELFAKGLVDVMKESQLEKFGVLAHGPESSILAMKVAAAHPGQVTHLVLINPRSAGDVYSSHIENIKREGMRTQNKEMQKGADNLLIQQDGKPKYMPSDSAEESGMGRALYNACFSDATEPETGKLMYNFKLPGGARAMADHGWSVKKLFGTSSTLPVLIFMGTKDPWTPLGDMKLAASSFKRATVVEMTDSSEFPFISETYKFTRSMQDFFKTAKPPKSKDSATKAKEPGPKGKTEVKAKGAPKSGG